MFDIWQVKTEDKDCDKKCKRDKDKGEDDAGDDVSVIQSGPWRWISVHSFSSLNITLSSLLLQEDELRECKKDEDRCKKDCEEECEDDCDDFWPGSKSNLFYISCSF